MLPESLFFAAAFALSGLAIGLWFERFISVTLARDDWLGWAAFGLVGIMGFAALMIILRELIGLFKLSRLKSFREDADKAVNDSDAHQARALTTKLINVYGGRRDMKWAMARFREHDGDILEGPGMAPAARSMAASFRISEWIMRWSFLSETGSNER